MSPLPRAGGAHDGLGTAEERVSGVAGAVCFLLGGASGLLAGGFG